MSVPPELVQKMMAGGGGGAPGAAGGGAPGAPPGAGSGAPPGGADEMNPGGHAPGAAPMSKPQEKKGLKAAAHTNIHIAVNMLEEALPAFGSESPEGGKILAALKTLAGLVGKKDTSDLVPAEVLQMVRRLPQMGGGTSVQQQLLKQMQSAKPQPAPAAA